jgi:predicted DsbA family dithiol-disulfide isomerase
MKSSDTAALGSPEFSTSTTRNLEVFADLWCPFAYVGLRCVADERARMGREDVPLLIRAWPLELVNRTPLDPVTTAHHVGELREQVAPDLFRHFDLGAFPDTTLPALAYVHAAYRRDLATGEAVGLALREALFEHGRDISSHEVLTEVAGVYGVGSPDADDERSVVADWKEGVQRGVEGSPHFFCGDHDVFCPSLDILRIGKEHLDIRTNLEGLDAFLVGCFGP